MRATGFRLCECRCVAEPDAGVSGDGRSPRCGDRGRDEDRRGWRVCGWSGVVGFAWRTAPLRGAWVWWVLSGGFAALNPRLLTDIALRCGVGRLWQRSSLLAGFVALGSVCRCWQRWSLLVGRVCDLRGGLDGGACGDGCSLHCGGAGNREDCTLGRVTVIMRGGGGGVRRCWRL